MRVIDLTKSAGNFETHSISPGRRQYGLWSYAAPQPGDLVVIQRTGYIVIYRLESTQRDFTGSDGNSFWRGEMVDTGPVAAAADALRPEEASLIVAAGLAQWARMTA